MQAVTAFVLLLAAAVHGSATSLAEAAFFESLRRAMSPAAGFAIRMVDVPAVAPGAAPPVAAADPATAGTVEPGSKASESQVGDDKTAGSAHGEDAWRAKMGAARAALERDQVLAEAMQGRVNGLTSEMLARDDPKQRDDLSRRRARALTELDHLTLQIEKDKLAIATIEEDARKKGIPAGWIR